MTLALDRRTLLATLARAGLALPFVAAGLAGRAGDVAAQRNSRPQYYWTLLRTGAPSDLTVLLDALSRTLGHHQLLGTAEFEAWGGEGLLPISCSEKPMRENAYDGRVTRSGSEINDTLELAAGTVVHALEVSVYAPPTLDIPAYAENLQFTVALAKAVDAKIVYDSSTSEFIELDEFESYPEKLAAFDIEDAHVRINYSAVQTRELKVTGLTKCGLPDLFVPSGLHGEKSISMVKLIARGLLVGVPIEQGKIIIPREHVTLADTGSTDLVAHLKPDGDRLAVSFGDGSRSQQEHQQAQWIARKGKDFDDFPLLSRADALAVAMAVARLHGTFDTSVATRVSDTSTRVFVRKTLPETVHQYPANAQDKLGMMEALRQGQFAWHHVTSWDDPGEIKVTVWEGDPRQGGQPLNVMPSGWFGWLLYILSSDDADNPLSPLMAKSMSEGEIVDVLIIHPDGRSEGGDISARAEHLAARAAKP